MNIETLKKQNAELAVALRDVRAATLRDAADVCRNAATKYEQRGRHSGPGWQLAVYLEREIMALPSDSPALPIGQDAEIKAACDRVDWASNEPAGALLMAAMKEEIADLRAALADRQPAMGAGSLPDEAEIIRAARLARLGLDTMSRWQFDERGIVELVLAFAAPRPTASAAHLLAAISGESAADTPIGYANLETVDFAICFYQDKIPNGYLPVYLRPTAAPRQEGGAA